MEDFDIKTKIITEEENLLRKGVKLDLNSLLEKLGSELPALEVKCTSLPPYDMSKRKGGFYRKIELPNMALSSKIWIAQNRTRLTKALCNNHILDYLFNNKKDHINGCLAIVAILIVCKLLPPFCYKALYDLACYIYKFGYDKFCNVPYKNTYKLLSYRFKYKLVPLFI